MKAVITRVTEAKVTVAGEVVGEISAPATGGLLALVGVATTDTQADAQLMARKLAELRILSGEVSASDVNAPLLLVSQFTLLGRTAKGRRPSWSDAAKGPEAEHLFNQVVQLLQERGLQVATGQFGAMMQVASVNDGPFTVLVDTAKTA